MKTLLLIPDAGVLVEEILFKTGTNISVSCPGLTRNMVVLNLEWYCNGQCGKSHLELKHTRHNLLKYAKDQGTTVFQSSRVQLDMNTFALKLNNLTTFDQGRYVCIINERPVPDAIIKLKVLGEHSKSCREFFHCFVRIFHHNTFLYY